MPSLRPSEFNLPARTDGGPFLIIEPADFGRGGVDVYFTDVLTEARQPDSSVGLLLNVTPDELTIWPLTVREGEDYLYPKYGKLEEIIITRRVSHPYALPSTTEDVEMLLEELPEGFIKNFRFGLGLLWEYRSICETISVLGDIKILYLHEGDDVKIDPPILILGRQRFDELRRELNRITARHQREARKDKLFSTYRSLLHEADQDRFPARKKRLKPGGLSELTRGGCDHTTLSKKDQRVAVRLVQDNMETLASTEPQMLLSLKSEIELVTLKQLIERYQGMLEKGLSESKWQAFFHENPFILSLAFAVPFMLVQGQAYAGGKRLDGRGGKYADFLCATVSTGNIALVEIKKPKTELLCQTPYRGDDVFGPSTELGGALAQVLAQRVNLQRELPIIKDHTNRHDIHAFALRCIVIAGTTPLDHHKKKSFELVRNALSDVAIVTFDELGSRLAEVYKALTPVPPDHTPPF